MFYSKLLVYLFVLGSIYAFDDSFPGFNLPTGYDIELLQEKSPVLHVVKRQAGNDKTTTTLAPTTPAPTTPAPTTPAPQLDVTTPSTNVTTTSVPPTTTASPGIQGPFNISDINERNYTFIEHTSFVDGMNGWDFTGLWLKLDLNNAGAQSPVPLPKISNSAGVEGGGNVGGAGGSGAGGEGGTGEGSVPGTKNKMIQLRQETDGVTTPPSTLNQPDDNNWVFISYASRVAGTLKKSFESLSDGAVFFTYFVMDDTAEFTVTLQNKNDNKYTLFNNSNNGTGNNIWITQAVNFTREQTLSDRFKLLFNVSGQKTTNDTERIVWVALHHVAVGGAMLPSEPSTTPSPVVLPPGALDDIRKISNSIWIALYVFLFFFLLAIAALIFLIVRGRFRQSRGSANDYDPNTSYRLDKVYDNPAYDANST